MKPKVITYIISGILSAILLAYLLLNLDWDILKKAFSDIHWGWLAVALAAYLVNICLRALRFSNLIYTRNVHWLEIVPVSALHNILMYLLPAKTGDVTYIFLAKNRLDVSMAEGTATLLAARYYDFSVVALVLAIILPFTREEMPDWIYRSSLLFCALVLLGSLVIFAFLQFSKPTLTPQSTSEGKKNVKARILSAWNKFLEGLREIRAHGAHTRTALLTAGIWMCVYLNFYSAAQSMGLPVSFYHVVVISIVMIPLTLLPLQGFANIGTHEVGWASVLVAFNYPYETALAIAAGSHFVLLISILISGTAAFFGAQAASALLRGNKS
ncbi:MAG: flippase-like domain-containing protein [Anaerolineales bacterium]|nr:flippase-like domain-containing protein [Anaerolineales bacterium]